MNSLDLSDSLESLRLSTNAIDNTIQKITGMVPEYEDLLVLMLLERNRNASEAIISLIPSLEKSRRIEFGVGLILRTLFLDVLVTLKLHDIISQQPYIGQSLGEFTFDILSDGVSYTLQLVKDDFDNKRMTRAEWIKFQNDMYSRFTDFFHPFEGGDLKPIRPFKDKRTSPIKLFKDITPMGPKNNFVANVYKRYSWFSKYEHINILYHDTSRDQDEHLIDRLTYGFDLMLIQSSLLHEVLRFLFAGRIDLASNVKEAKTIAQHYVSNV